METRHIEIERFARKAGGYKKAIEMAPHARDLELCAVVAMVLGACRKRGWPPKETRVVDLLAGSGALAVALKAAGFEQTSALEACTEMLPDRESGVEFVNGRAFKNLHNSLRELSPQVIVSLAGFHHLIERTGKGVDRLRSVVAQASLAGACVDALAPGGVLLVADIAEDEDFGKLGIDSLNEWDGSAFKLLGCEVALRDDLKATTSVGAYEQTLRNRFGEISLNGTLKWFREFVDPKTAVGHDDVAISAPLLQLLSWKYGDAVRFVRFRCPWVFETKGQAKDFVLQKFGFYVDRAASEVNPGVVEDGMKTYLGFRGSDEKSYILDWSLAAYMVKAPDSEANTSFRATKTVVLLIISVIMLVRTGVKAMAGEGTVIDTALSGGMWLVVGILAKILVDDLKRKLDR